MLRVGYHMLMIIGVGLLRSSAPEIPGAHTAQRPSEQPPALSIS
ncbi:MAG TPA: hypothetical protein VJ746_01010 [Nitrospira sp.]|nr:hypothetical protein [Nitrospira sp.]